METVLFASSAALLAAVAWPIATAPLAPEPSSTAPAVPATPIPSSTHPKIQLALLLDTSSSMDGLIDQARTQLWSVVNALDAATFQDATPQFEIAVYEYGNDRLSERSGYIRQVVPFSSELDLVSEGLFALTTAGGDEFAGQAIGRATEELRWDESDAVLRVMYVAGNESFSQGPTPFRATVAAAKAKGIVVNTVNCTGYGNWDQGWQAAAELGGGQALRIDQTQRQAYVASPHDAEIARLSTLLNATYLTYGARGSSAFANQAAQDANSLEAGRASTIARAVSKTSRYYDNAGWDLVDGVERGKIDLPNIDRSTLPRHLSTLDDDALAKAVADAGKERERLQAKIRALNTKREAYIADQRSNDGERLDNAIIESITTQARAAGFSL